jgi:hypothetical protein
VSAHIYLEGGAAGADSKYLKTLCQKAFHKLLDRMGFTGRKPRLVACGGRGEVYNHFAIQHAQTTEGYVAMWIDSEEPMADREAAWSHLRSVTTVGKWDQPAGAEDDQVLFMTTCMETWIVADRSALSEHYGAKLQENALPALNDLENRSRAAIQDKLTQATRLCSNAYAKGEASYKVFPKLNPATLEERLPSFARVRRILESKL